MVEWCVVGGLVPPFLQDYPIVSIEYPFNQDDSESWGQSTGSVTTKIAGDALTVMNPVRIETTIEKKAYNGLLL